MCYIDPATDEVTRWLVKTSSDSTDFVADELEIATAFGDIIFINGQAESYLIDHNTLEVRSFGMPSSKDDPIHYVYQDGKGNIWYISKSGFGYLDSSFSKPYNFTKKYIIHIYL